ncbi:hypothetical protein O181_018043 [Austropuccinia psidii MF-1]|uniref:Peroxisomal membrane protein PEX14-like KPWE domain-containing protein n=1 Tax=Austropuccinia psidii MF-1 TaxID=1389203 RepID=A0A9Q3GSB9_9BASI|nr:hypothetical protein [Austropuccinia psidii MF-1]
MMLEAFGGHCPSLAVMICFVGCTSPHGGDAADALAAQAAKEGAEYAAIDVLTRFQLEPHNFRVKSKMASSDKEIFLAGLENIILSYEQSLNRKLNSSEIVDLTVKAEKFFRLNHQQHREQEPSETGQASQAGHGKSGQTEKQEKDESLHLIDQAPNDVSRQTENDAFKMDDAQSNTKEESEKLASAPPYPQSFAQLVDLIQSGQPIDQASLPEGSTNIRSIPDLINPDPPSQAMLALQNGAGKKPWEKS